MNSNLGKVLSCILNDRIQIEKHVRATKMERFACFVGKAFDSIWHDGLYDRLLQSAVGGQIFDIIKLNVLK